ncbi:F-box protein CPR1-like [Tripterygium wilfordii]|uniref:F-box protein CPR1-like n=1 Tax=Tripterygium wilfordii TaxID=458696 RepID=UPI0018F81047|nr:F-box protein CPR1-like [Tripterygium wilfordii]
MRSCRIKEILSSYLPIELIINILYRLPVKSLIRFKSVSKPWKSLVEDPDFVKSYMDQQQVKTKRLITKCDTSSFLSTDLDSLDKLSIVNMPKLQRSYRHIELIGSSNGLVTLCCTFSNLNDPLVFDFIIWNMATRKHLIIPLELPHPPKCTLLVQGFGYNSVCDDYKVVRAFKSGGGGGDGDDLITMVYSLKKHEWVWSTINSPDYHFEDLLVGSLVSNGALHWLAFEGYAWDPIIVAFDLNTEEYHKVSLPVNVIADELESLRLAVLGDSLCILVDVGDVDIWVIKDYMVKESWTKVYSLRLKIFPMPLAFSISGDGTTLLLLKYKEFAHRAYWYNPSESTIYLCKPSLEEEVQIFVAPSSRFVTAMIYEESLTPIVGSKGTRGKPTLKQREK